jgi:hypothetical protein
VHVGDVSRPFHGRKRIGFGRDRVVLLRRQQRRWLGIERDFDQHRRG